jgi:hypothetical protein
VSRSRYDFWNAGGNVISDFSYWKRIDNHLAMTERTKGKAWLLGRAAANDKAHEQAELRLWWVACGLKGRVQAFERLAQAPR